MRVLVTGASGFIGRHLIPRLVRDHEVVTLGRRPVAGTIHVLHDLAHPLPTAELPRTLDAIVHLAALIDADRAGDARLPLAVNVAATMDLMTYARDAGATTFVYGSTGGVVGCSDRPLDESDPYNPMDLYALTKSQAEIAVRSMEAPFQRVVLRYCFPYGLGTPNPISSMFESILDGTEIPFASAGTPRLNPLHVDDAVAATLRAMQIPGDHLLNIAGEEVTTFAEIALMAGAELGIAPRFELEPRSETIPYYRKDLIASTELSRRILGDYYRTTLARGIPAFARAVAERRR